MSEVEYPMSNTRPAEVQEAMKNAEIVARMNPEDRDTLDDSLVVIAAYIQELETTLSLRDTYIDDRDAEIATLKTERERSFQVLELAGVPRERASSVANGIQVLLSRMKRHIQDLQAELAEARKGRGVEECL